MTTIRAATPTDASFLEAMLVLAADWRPDQPERTVDALRTDPSLWHYVAGWPRPGDVGVVAETDQGRLIGAAWYRTFGADDPGFGFVSGDVPEVSIAVVPDARGAGVGRRLMIALIDEAQGRGVARLSLSVEVDNPAMSLYLGVGFVEVDRADGAATMVLDLPDTSR